MSHVMDLRVTIKGTMTFKGTFSRLLGPGAAWKAPDLSNDAELDFLQIACTSLANMQSALFCIKLRYYTCNSALPSLRFRNVDCHRPDLAHLQMLSMRCQR